jgi:hypothetical protein
MFGRNIDFFAVSVIALVMLGFTVVRQWHLPPGLDSIRVENAIQIERCPISRQVFSRLAAMLH